MTTTTEANYRSIPLRTLDADALASLSAEMKLSLSREDMLAVQEYFNQAGREPTDVELEVIAQTWSEHCKHRIFGALIQHQRDGKKETIDGLFKTFIMKPTHAMMEQRPGFVLSAFHDNAGFIRLDDEHAVCLKVETHNHPSAIEPYAGANTGIGGVIRDILGAGKGAKPIASVDVFCFGPPNTTEEKIRSEDVIHPLGVMRGVVRGVRDYGNRMGIPTVAGALQFDDTYIYNPLVFCGTAGVIPNADIDKRMSPGLSILAVGGRTGRDGLKGATFSSASLTGDSHAEDMSAVQIGNPIEEKKVCDFILAAREEGLITFVTDCGAGGFSSAAGEMLSETGGTIYLERCPLKEPGLFSWEVFLSESQERMVLAVDPGCVDRLSQLAAIYETEMTEIGQSDDSGILKVLHHDETVCELDCGKLHDAPRRHLEANWQSPVTRNDHDWSGIQPADALRQLLADFAICSRAPIIREYDHEVQGNTILKPLAGAMGDAPQDGSVIEIDNSNQAVAISLSLLPEWGKTDPYRMGMACIDECVRQLVLTGANPDKIGLLDNFCVGNPDDQRELGALVETTKGIAAAARAYAAPFISGKDSFYNYFITDDGPVSIPITCLISGIGIVDELSHVTGASLRHADSVLFLIGDTASAHMGGSVLARLQGINDAEVPATNTQTNFAIYHAFHSARCAGLVRSAHDCSEGGLGVALAEMGFSLRAGIDIDLAALGDAQANAQLFNEAPGRLIVEVAADHLSAFAEHFADLPIARIGNTHQNHQNLLIKHGGSTLLSENLSELKALWKNGLTPYY